MAASLHVLHLVENSKEQDRVQANGKDIKHPQHPRSGTSPLFQNNSAIQIRFGAS